MADFSVTLDADGSVFLNREEVRVSDLGEAITNQLEPEQESLITIRADKKVFHGQVVEAMDILRSIDRARIGIATQPKASE